MLHQESRGLFHLHNKKIIDAVAEICSACEKGGVVCLYKMREEHCKKLRCEMKRKMYILDLNRGWVKLVTPTINHDTLIRGRGF